jgi:hypothetical protein
MESLFESFRKRKINVFSNPHGSDGTRQILTQK